VGARLACLLLILLVALASCACKRADQVIELTHWTLVSPSGARRAVTVPVQFSAGDMDAAGNVELETTLEVPPTWRSGPLTLALPWFVGDAKLEAAGADLPATTVSMTYAWSLPAAASGNAAVPLRLRLDARATPGLASKPRLSATTGGDALFRESRAFNFFTALIALTLGGFLALLYALLFLLDRSRRAHGWFVLQSLTVLPVAGLQAGVLLGLMPWTIQVTAYGAVVGTVAAEGFARAYFRRPPLPRAWIAGLALLGVVSATARTTEARSAVEATTAFLATASATWQIVMDLRELRRGRDPIPAATLAASWIVILVCFVPDVFAVLRLPDFAVGFRGASVGVTLYALGQVVILSRDHVRSLREAEDRVKELETQRGEVDALNDELRRQVAERSRELTEALARSEGSLAPAALEVGDVFDGRYRVSRALGRGGMGAVYEVERARDGKKLALKVVTAALQAKQAARFAREAEIGARLQHENLVAIVDVGIAAGATPFLVMELVRGGSLEEKRARFGDAAWARPIVRQIAAGLAELHANRIVHRDLKPGNVLLVENGGASPPVAKISDFGISRFGAIDDSGDVDDRSANAHPGAAHSSPRDLTETGALMGTPVYMPPEAWFGPARHPSADVFSLGVLAYEALTGRSPFAVPPVLLVRARQPIPTPAPLDGIDAMVASLVLACLRVEPSERPRAKEVAEALV
jgi:Protein kinase domain